MGWWSFYKGTFLLISFMRREKKIEKERRWKKYLNMREMIRENNEFLVIYWFVDGGRDYWVILLPKY